MNKKPARKVRSTESKRRATHRERVEQTPPQVIEVIEEVRTEPGPVALLQLEIGVLQNRLKEHEERTSKRIEEIVEVNSLNIANLQDQLRVYQQQISDLTLEATQLNTHLHKVKMYLDNTQKSPIAQPPPRPVIGLVPFPTRDDNGITISVIGRGFAPSDGSNPNVSIYVLGRDEPQKASSSAEGTLSYSFTIPVESDAPAQTYTLAATDSSPNVQDWTGELWSNSVSFVL